MPLTLLGLLLPFPPLYLTKTRIFLHGVLCRFMIVALSQSAASQWENKGRQLMAKQIERRDSSLKITLSSICLSSVNHCKNRPGKGKYMSICLSAAKESSVTWSEFITGSITFNENAEKICCVKKVTAGQVVCLLKMERAWKRSSARSAASPPTTSEKVTGGWDVNASKGFVFQRDVTDLSMHPAYDGWIAQLRRCSRRIGGALKHHLPALHRVSSCPCPLWQSLFNFHLGC